MKFISIITALLSSFLVFTSAQSYIDDSGKVKVILVKDPFTDSRSGPERLKGPALLDNPGLKEVLHKSGCEIIKISEIEMPPDLERAYGEWNRASLTNRTLGRIISESL